MKQFIRTNTFETNSSSMHSLVVVKDPKPYNLYEKLESYSDYNEFELFGCCDRSSFERSPFEVLRSQGDKLRYYVAHYVGYLNKKELLPKIKEFIHNQTGIPLNKIELRAELTYLSENDWTNKRESYGYAGLNDTGEDVFEYIERNNITMEEFVLNPKYTVIIDGDEYQEFKKLFDSNILNANDFEYISSGPDFWNNNILNLSLYWPENNNESLLTYLSNINKFKDEIRVRIWNDYGYIDLYNKYFDELKTFKEEALKLQPNIKFTISCTKDNLEEVKKLDLSIFDSIKVYATEYSDNVIEEINLKENK